MKGGPTYYNMDFYFSYYVTGELESGRGCVHRGAADEAVDAGLHAAAVARLRLPAAAARAARAARARPARAAALTATPPPPHAHTAGNTLLCHLLTLQL